MPRATKEYEVREYLRDGGGSPFRDWLDGLALPIRARIQARIARFQAGNIGDARSVGAGVHEARFTIGPGYRIYFGLDGTTLIILLCGGDKGSQKRDIKRAKDLWNDYLARDES